MLAYYQQHLNDRKKQHLPPKSLDAKQADELVKLIQSNTNDPAILLHLLSECVPPGVDEAAYIKAAFLSNIAFRQTPCALISPVEATKLLGSMRGGYNVESLVKLLNMDESVAKQAAHALSHTILVYDHFHDIVKLANQGNVHAQSVLQTWADAKWFLNTPEIENVMKLAVFKVDGEINTDDLSPATEAWSRPDIPLHATSMLTNTLTDAAKQIEAINALGHPVAFVGDVVGTGSSRKSAMNSLLWHFGKPIPFVPNKKQGGVVLGQKIAPIFFNTAQDSGVLPIECDVSQLKMGDIITICPHDGQIKNEAGQTVSTFNLRPNTLLDEIRAGGRIHLIIGRGLTDKAREVLGLKPSEVFIRPQTPVLDQKFTLAQKMVGRACGVKGIAPHTYCEPKMSTVGSQDTTGAMTRDELKELACLGFSADLVMQSFCHTAAYPKPVDIKLQHSLPDFIISRGGVSLNPGDGIIHSWLNRMLLPDTVGTGGDSHTRFPLGISFPAGSGLVAFAATSGVMPLDMPESVLVRFKGEMQPGITLRDLVNAIPYVAIQKGLLTVEKENKQNIFSGRVLEIEGLGDLKVEQAFELSDASAERSANGCTVRLNKAPIVEYLQSNIVLLKNMIGAGYGEKKTLARRIQCMQQWLDKPELLVPDRDCAYAAEIEINLNEMTQPLLACPNDPDNIKQLSDVTNNPIDEVFIGSCMTNIGHFRAAAKLLTNYRNLSTRLWVVPPTRMDEAQLIEEGYYSIFGQVGARTETPGCSLCMGNQARVADGAAVMSSSTRNFPNRMGKDANVYLGSVELCAICAILGRMPTTDEYQTHMKVLENQVGDIYRYLNFDQLQAYIKRSNAVSIDSILHQA